MTKKKVLHLITGVELGGGAENMLLQLLPRMQDDLDNRVCVIKGRGKIGKRLEEKGIPVYYLDLKDILDLGVILRYRKLVNNFNPDIQLNYLTHADIFGRIFGKIFGVRRIVPYIRSVHTIKKNKIFYFLEKITINLADFILTNSEITRNFYIRRFKIKENAIKCIPNAVDTDKFDKIIVDKTKKRKELNLPEEKKIICSVSRLEKIKDIPTIIRAFKIVSRKYDNAHLLIVGSGKERDDVINLIREMDLSDVITILEKRTDIPEILYAIDIFVLASLSEGMSNALLEAMASGKAIASSDIDENMELIKNNENGLSFKVGNPDDLAEKLLFLLRNESRVDYFGEKSREKIKCEYSIDTIADSIIKTIINEEI